MSSPPLPHLLRFPGAVRERRGVVLAALWLVAVAGVEVLQHLTGLPRVEELAASPAALAAGKVWTLATSAFMIAGSPPAQYVATTAVVAAVVALAGARTFWIAAITAHVGATLIAYAGIAVLWVVARPDVDALIAAPDYGISAVWAGGVGALAAVAVSRSGERRRLSVGLALGGLLVFMVLVPVGGELADVEHLLAFALGALVTACGLRPRPAAV
jgi:hypothetical protein